jgi:eukaryotic-like serine/threonine-protein kinase
VEPDRWQRVAALCGQALEVPATDRTAFLRERCGDDQALRGEVESLLSIASKPGPLDISIAPEEFQPSAVIAGRFRILRLIGRGGMGQVYQAEDLQMGGYIALKTIRPDLLDNPQSTELFKREIQLAKKVTNPHVCRIYDVGFHPSSSDPDARMFLTMELLEGQTVSKRLAAGPLSAAEALPLIEQMADALGAAHRAGIVHRDFKSGNVMLVPHAAGIRAVVMDFGLARMAAQSQSAHTEAATETLGAVGTPEYMAPEQLTGGAITPATDIYALGIVIYEMVTGIRPFQGSTPFDIAIRRLHETPPSPRQLAPGLEPRWEKTILRCLSRRPEERFQSTSELLLALSGQSAVREGPRRKGWLKAAAAAFVIVAIAAAFLLIRSPKQHSKGRVEWQQLTNFSDTATDPALSPDGRMLAFKRGGSWFLSPGQIYVKVLPDGHPVPLTHDPFPKMAPAFSPDGTSVYYTEIRRGSDGWEIREASVLQGGGEPRQVLTNAEGLTWIDKQHVLFSEQRDSPLMVVVTSTESRTASRDVYLPQDAKAMAHFSALSPDHKQVLIEEMAPGSDFVPCRLAPFDGSSKGRLVGPAPGSCIAAAWSPDGKWMYFSARRENDKFHVWRQRTEGGEPEQITSGPSEERGLAIAADGRSLITSVGVNQTTVWIHDASGERQISGEGNAGDPQFTPDGKKVYYLSASDLWASDLASGQAERVLPGVAVDEYVLSREGNAIAYTTADGSLWYGPIDRGMPPRKLAAKGRNPVFGASGDIFFNVADESSLYRVHPDGSGLADVPGLPGSPKAMMSFPSPDEEWVIGVSLGHRTVAYARNGGRTIPLCEECWQSWSPDGKFFQITLGTLSGQKVLTGLIPLKNKSMIPALPPEGVRTEADLRHIPGVQVIPSLEVSPAPGGSSYAFVKQESRWNLFRISLP